MNAEESLNWAFFGQRSDPPRRKVHHSLGHYTEFQPLISAVEQIKGIQYKKPRRETRQKYKILSVLILLYVNET